VTPPTTAPATPLAGPLRRAAIIVRDLDRSLTLYRDVLGLTLFKEAAADQHAVLFRLLGLAPAKARFAILQGAADGTPSELGMLGLFEVSDPMPGVLRRPDHSVRVGEVALVFLTPAVDSVAARVAALGLSIVCPPTRFEVPGGGLAREMTFRDFDGALVNMIQRQF
jgi:catechol 2,3-dioxygenase-like lactoylglutathione lyase family enzyme